MQWNVYENSSGKIRGRKKMLDLIDSCSLPRDIEEIKWNL